MEAITTLLICSCLGPMWLQGRSWKQGWGGLVQNQNKNKKDNNNGLLSWLKAMDGAGVGYHEQTRPSIGAHGPCSRPMALVFLLPCFNYLVSSENGFFWQQLAGGGCAGTFANR